MTYTSVSPKFQVVIPKAIRQRVAMRPRQKLMVMEKRGIIHLIPETPLVQMKGLFKGRGLTTANLREKKDRL
ncbi:MAG: AbrB/MazE/SpoVT family DNA-binding domain-containing protein [Deltaproteobacteria bacterium]|nr:AbrB/MazE/SpoVT family DNA-binding domain-containing protein [Deltaproteobacteria bacterium]